MPAIAPVEDLRAAPKELLDRGMEIITYDLCHTVIGGKSVSSGWSEE
jgi:hypothetical protein